MIRQQPESQFASGSSGDRKRFREQVRQMRDSRDCPIVFQRFGRHDDRAAVECKVGDLRPHVCVDALVGGNDPYRVDEQIGIPDRPTRS
ncbi:hypothetical protein EN35_32375 [Rhodococcus qingshengii]|nr:hypothetical protein EN35_32375 [Rhodococcus qingshengii]